MGKTPPEKLKPEDIETEPGAEERFERTVRRMLNTPPKPHKPFKSEGPSPKRERASVEKPTKRKRRKQQSSDE